MRWASSSFVPVILAVAASGGAVWLGVQSQAAVPGCGPDGGCGQVLSSRWSEYRGVPVALAGAVLWGAMAVLAGAFVRGSRSAAGWAASFAITGTLLGAGWFTGLQVWALKAFCPVCLALHGMAVTAALLLLRQRRATARCGGVSLTGGWLAGSAAMALLAATWPAHEPAAALVQTLPEPARRQLPGESGEALDLSGLPVAGTGTPRAVMLMDFTCTHCRRMLTALRAMAAQDAAMPAVALLPACLNGESEKIHRTLLSLFRSDAAAWEKVVAALLEGTLPARADDVAQAAMQAAGPEKLGAALQTGQEEIRRALDSAAALYAANRKAPGGNAALPQLMSGTRLLTGIETDAARLAAFLGTSPAPVPAPPATAHPLPEMRPAKSTAALPQWRPHPLPPEQQSPQPPPDLVNAP